MLTSPSLLKTWLWTTLLVSFVAETASFTSRSCRHRRQHKDTSCRRQAASTPFDFSSPREWDRFYQERKHKSGKDEFILPIEVEWHDSIPLQDIANAVPPQSTVLMVGCGTSRLPQVLLEQNAPKRMVLLDTSQTCLDQLREILPASSNTTTAIDYVCGDATRLVDYFGATTNGDKDDAIPMSFDAIIDKGLTDAILCSEGWDGPLARMLEQAATILRPETGQYLLISYQLPRTTQEFLVEVCSQVGLEWEFDVDLLSRSNGAMQDMGEETSTKSRCMVSLATRRSPA